VAQLLYSHGDVRQPLPETVRVLDEIVTEFIQGAAFEAARNASYAGRQKIKWEDFEFAFRKNPAFLGKVQEVFQKKNEIDTAKKIFTKDDEATLMKENAAGDDGKGEKAAAAAGAPKTGQDDEELGEADDIDDNVSEAVSRRGRG
jgi:transcription initiation factor TFIID subunit 13